MIGMMNKTKNIEIKNIEMSGVKISSKVSGMRLRKNFSMYARTHTPKITPIRGGTDGARLSFKGLPCPNLCTGGHNFHGRFEYIPVQSMEKMADILVELVRVMAE